MGDLAAYALTTIWMGLLRSPVSARDAGVRRRHAALCIGVADHGACASDTVPQRKRLAANRVGMRVHGVAIRPHFSDLKKHHQIGLAEYLQLVRGKREFLSIKANTFCQKDSHRKIEEIVHRLHERMMVEGAKHEVNSHRIRLPHDIQLTIDEDQRLDKLACIDIKERIERAYKDAYGNELRIASVEVANSEYSQMIQLADLIAGALNRKLNHPGGTHYKDEMADMILSELGIELRPDKDDELDSAVLLSL